MHTPDNLSQEKRWLDKGFIVSPAPDAFALEVTPSRPYAQREDLPGHWALYEVASVDGRLVRRLLGASTSKGAATAAAASVLRRTDKAAMRIKAAYVVTPSSTAVIASRNNGALIKPMGAESARVWRDRPADFIENEEREND